MIQRVKRPTRALLLIRKTKSTQAAQNMLHSIWGELVRTNDKEVRAMKTSNRVYSASEIKERLTPVFSRHGVKRAILFGSYSKGNADSSSDIDLLVDSGLHGLAFVDLIEDVHETMQKDVDLLDVSHIEKGSRVEQEIQKTGTEIYAK